MRFQRRFWDAGHFREVGTVKAIGTSLKHYTAKTRSSNAWRIIPTRNGSAVQTALDKASARGQGNSGMRPCGLRAVERVVGPGLGSYVTAGFAPPHSAV
jgi:hypothetical protein